MKNTTKHFIILLALIAPLGLFAQCPDNNVAYFSPFSEPSPGNTNTECCVYAGEYATLPVTIGNEYVIQSCNSMFASDSYITLYNATGGAALAWDDNSCGNTHATITWTAPFTGTIKILVDQGSGCASNLTNHQIDVTNNGGGCAISASITSQSNISCNGANNGSLTVTQSGGSANFSYAWSNGSTTSNTSSSTNTISSLSAGTYTVTVTDNNSCTATASATITEPGPISASITSQTNVACNGNNMGSITVTKSGGVANFSYFWSNGANTTNTSSSTNTIFGLAAGTYTVTVSDANSCTATTSGTITQPTALVASASVSSTLDCNGDTDGQVTASGSGGTTSYTYSWNTGGTSATETGLGAGTYSVTITDANGCTDSASITLSEPTALVASAVVDSNETCATGNDGGLTASASGGTTSYTYSWSNAGTTASITSVAAGTYSVTITDANGCTDSASATVTQNAMTSYKDVDGDGYSDGVTSSLCPPPTNFYFAGSLIATSGDCKDTLANVNPGMPELPGNGLDDNCDTQTDDVPCSLPTGFSTSGISYDRALLNWTDALGTTSIKVRYRKVGDLVWTTTTVQEGNGSKLIYPLDGGTDYEWQARTVCDMIRTSSWSASQNFTTLDATIANGFCPTPGAFNTTNITATKALLSWTPAGSVPFHKLRYRAVGGGGWTKYTINAPANDKQLSGLNPNTNYEWQIKTSCGINNRSQWSTLQNFATAILCGPITGVDAFHISDTSAYISWDTLSGVDAYKIRYKPTVGSNWTARSVAHPTDIRQIIGLSAGTQYEYRVDLDCSTGDKVVGALDTFTTDPPLRLPSPNTIDENGDEFGYSIYPNPNTGQFTVEAWGEIKGNVVISLTDVTGRILMNRTWNADVEGRLEPNTDLPSGVYLISIEANGARFNERLIVKR